LYTSRHSSSVTSDKQIIASLSAAASTFFSVLDNLGLFGALQHAFFSPILDVFLSKMLKSMHGSQGQEVPGEWNMQGFDTICISVA
jgi:hypothetical protein